MPEIPIVTRIIDMKRRKEDVIKETPQEETRTRGYSLKAAIDKEARRRIEGTPERLSLGQLYPNYPVLLLCFTITSHAYLPTGRLCLPKERNMSHAPE